MSKEFSEINLSKSNGEKDGFMVHYDDGDTATFEASTSNGIAKISKVSESGNDQYTFTFLNGTEVMMPVANGEAFAKMNTAETKRYGVSGIGQQTAALTRLFDAVGMSAAVGTDDSSVSVVNDFDAAGPWMHRKCVGHWPAEDGHAKFVVEAYYGDPAYAEDGTKGDYVAVELPLSYYQLTGTQLVISSFKYPGYKAFDIFCRDHDQTDLIEKVYVPAYALALDSDGHAVSLPGLDNEQGAYKGLFESARKYNNNDIKDLGMMMPAALQFYYWALSVVEFATQNLQSIMAGCADLRSNGDDRVTFMDATHILTSNYQAGRVAGEFVAILATSVSDINDSSKKATHKVLSVTRCDENGDADDAGTHQKLEVEDLGKGYYTYDTTGETEYKIGVRPYQTGSCNSVVTPSGSPVNNTDSYHPMRYRYRENVWGNQYHTAVDLFALRVGTGDSDYKLEWYYLPDPSDITTPGNPDAAALAASPYEKLGIETAHENYKTGFIKSVKYDEKYPDIWIPFETTGGSATTYFCDYASLVSSNSARAVRLGGYWGSGTSDGPSIILANSATSTATATSGADLCFPQ